jgi:hypothetical protein
MFTGTSVSAQLNLTPGKVLIEISSTFLILFVFCGQAFAADVYLVLSSDSETNRHAAALIEQKVKLADKSTHIYTKLIDTFNPAHINSDDLLVTIGNQAIGEITQLDISNPIIFSFSKRVFLPKNEGNWSAVVTEQPISRLIKSIKPLLSEKYKKQLLLVASTKNDFVQNQLELSAEPQLKLITVPPNDNPAKLIDKALFHAGALIALNDKYIWNTENARWLLYQAYRNNVAVVGYSKKFLKAGAVLAVYSTLDQIATTTASQITDWHQHNKLTNNKVIFSSYNIEYNKKIARILRIAVPEDEFDLENQS